MQLCRWQDGRGQFYQFFCGGNRSVLELRNSCTCTNTPGDHPGLEQRRCDLRSRAKSGSRAEYEGDPCKRRNRGLEVHHVHTRCTDYWFLLPHRIHITRVYNFNLAVSLPSPLNTLPYRGHPTYSSETLDIPLVRLPMKSSPSSSLPSDKPFEKLNCQPRFRPRLAPHFLSSWVITPTPRHLVWRQDGAPLHLVLVSTPEAFFWG